MTTIRAPRRTGTPRTRSKVSTRRRITPEDLLRFHLVADPQISPDGGQVVFAKKHAGEKNEYVTNLWMVATGSGSEPRQFTNGGRDSSPRWSPDGDRIAFIGARDKHKPQLFVIGVDGGEAVALTRLPGGSIGTFKWSPDGTSIAMSFRPQDPKWTQEAKKEREEKGLSDPPRVIDDWWYRLDGDGYFGTQRYGLYLIDATTGEQRKVFSRDTLGWFTFDFAPDSRRLVISANLDRQAMIRPWKDQLFIYDVESGRLERIPDLPVGTKSAVQWSPDGRLVAYVGREGKDAIYSTENQEVFVCDPVKGGARNLTGGEDYCLMAASLSDATEADFDPHIRWSRDGQHVYMLIGWHGEQQVASVPAAGGPVRFHTEGPFARTLGNISGDGRLMAMTVGSTTRLPEVWVARLRRSSFDARPLTDLNGPLLGELDLAEPQSHWVRAADGTRVQVWVMKPPVRKAGRKLPAVLEIHGGPHAQYGCGFFHEFQVLAANGYAVFYSNPRGSKGYGRDHCAAIRGSWGGSDWQDIQAVIGFMKKQPYVSSRRMGVMGGSYGGYMTNWVIGHTDIFAAAITDRCVSNIVSLLGKGDFIEAPDFYWPGNTWDRSEPLWERSPLKHFGNVKTPTLIIHSEGDLRCNIEQAEQVFTALKLLGVPTRLVRYPASTSHGFSRGGPPDMRLHRLDQILQWWREYLKG